MYCVLLRQNRRQGVTDCCLQFKAEYIQPGMLTKDKYAAGVFTENNIETQCLVNRLITSK